MTVGTITLDAKFFKRSEVQAALQLIATDHDALEALVDALNTTVNAKFDAVTGHVHTAAAGDAPKIDFGDLDNKPTIERYLSMGSDAVNSVVTAMLPINYRTPTGVSIQLKRIDIEVLDAPTGSSCSYAVRDDGVDITPDITIADGATFGTAAVAGQPIAGGSLLQLNCKTIGSTTPGGKPHVMLVYDFQIP
jgi:hypothetical protein